MTNKKRGPVICLAASGGGHLRQLLDLQNLWSTHNYFFVTEDTALGRSVAARHPTEFVPHFALGQAKLGRPYKMFREAIASVWRSLAIIRRHRPNFVITTGAGSQLFIALWARLFGARIILIDSFARFERPSAFARLAGPIAHLRLAQSAKSAHAWGGAKAFDPLINLPANHGVKDDLIFATVGATLPFPRLVDLVVEAKLAGRISENVILQVGDDDRNLPLVPDISIVRSMPFEDVQETLQRARIVICHGGTGSILTALRASCAVIVLPRLFSRGEHYDDHQLEITGSFERRGLLRSATDSEDLRKALDWARTFEPRVVTTDYSDMIEALREYIAVEGAA